MPPGNAIRNTVETELHFPEFVHMSTEQKLLMGFLSTSHYYIAGGRDNVCWVFGVLSLILLLSYLFADRHKKSSGLRRVLKRAAAICPFASYIIIAHVCRFLLYDAQVTYARNLIGVLIENDHAPGQSYFSRNMILLQAFVYGIVLLSVALTIFFIHGKPGRHSYSS